MGRRMDGWRECLSCFGSAVDHACSDVASSVKQSDRWDEKSCTLYDLISS